jgi:hypothetical protein
VRFIDDFVFTRDVRPDRSRKEQAKNGLRLGLGMGAFLIALMLLGSGLTRVVSSDSPQHVVWSDWMGWGEIGLACVLLLVTAQVWLLLVGGVALFGIGKSIFLLVYGEIPHTYRPVSRLEGAEAAFFCLTTLLLLFRFMDTRPNTLDRVALTFYVLAVAWSGHRTAFTLVDPWLTAGLIGLAVSWCIYHWKQAQQPESDANVLGNQRLNL